jgi:hypothetical protein
MINSTRILSDKFQGKTVYRLDTNGNHKPDAGEPMLVQRQGDGWKPAEQLDKPVNRFALESKYGFWSDRQVSHKEGWFWDRKEVVDRPQNELIEADEVTTNGFRRIGNGLYGSTNSFELGGEILKDSDGAFYLDEHSKTFGPHRIIGEGDIKSMEAYRADDSNWLVSKNPPPELIGVAQGPFVLGSGSTTITVPITGKLK